MALKERKVLATQIVFTDHHQQDDPPVPETLARTLRGLMSQLDPDVDEYQVNVVIQGSSLRRF